MFRHDDVMRVLNDPETFSNAVSSSLSLPNGMDSPPEHTQYRSIIQPYFSPRRMTIFELVCRKIATSLDRLLQNVASRNQLRDWFERVSERWDGFRQRYEHGLDARPTNWQPILDVATKWS